MHYTSLPAGTVTGGSVVARSLEKNVQKGITIGENAGNWVNFEICHTANADEATKYMSSNNNDASSITETGFQYDRRPT